MASLSSPNKMPSILNVKQIRHTAGVAVETAADYTERLRRYESRCKSAWRVPAGESRGV